jgi:hypothetical protein
MANNEGSTPKPYFYDVDAPMPNWEREMHHEWMSLHMADAVSTALFLRMTEEEFETYANTAWEIAQERHAELASLNADKSMAEIRADIQTQLDKLQSIGPLTSKDWAEMTDEQREHDIMHLELFMPRVSMWHRIHTRRAAEQPYEQRKP